MSAKTSSEIPIVTGSRIQLWNQNMFSAFSVTLAGRKPI
jgi:hypothetical protein